MAGQRGTFRRDQGFIITLVAVFLLFVVGAMAALSIDIVSFYTARSEAQLAADAAALAGARVIANSGATSDPTGETLASAEALVSGPGGIATQVAINNTVGGQPLQASNVTVNFNGGGGSPCSVAQPVFSNPCVTVQITTNAPAFFARIWGTRQVTIVATATAEAFNPSGLANGSTTGQAIPIAPSCVKPWLLPNLDPNPSNFGNPIFEKSSGAILDSTLLGWETPQGQSSTRLHARCGPSGTCDGSSATWQYFVGDDTSFLPPTQALPACTLANNFEASIAGCVQTPIVCGAAPASQVKIDVTSNANLDQDAATAVDCMAHLGGSKGDTINRTILPPDAFEFKAGDDDPLVEAHVLSSGAEIMVSDSLVTVPVFDNSGPNVTSGTPVTVIGFVQLFLQPSGRAVGFYNGTYQISTKVINIVGCGTNSNATNSSTPVYGNGATAVPVRLITPP